ncbi:MAG TPA: DPP IV N-terminal domain-containing protein [Candidatus Sphingobacterium stercorigallinarum]|nr:DPP IV N-terminal domain-containing protein [Candidatus Sphingobacterium stercorigallinarum]
MKYNFSFFFLFLAAAVFGQSPAEPVQPNYSLAAQFSPERLKKMIFSTEVEPNWIEYGERFWYQYSSPNGKNWYIVDPVAKKKTALFDRAVMAARLTSIVGDPLDAKNLDLKNLQFIEEGKVLQFDVLSSKDTLKSKKEIEKLSNKKDTLKKKTFHFHYLLDSRELREVTPEQIKKKRLSWANFNPDTTKIFYAKNYNLYWMDHSNYLKALEDEKDSTIVEHQFTTDGEQYYAWGGDQYSTTTGDRKSLEEERNKRRPVRLNWSPDGQHFTLTRKDNRDYSALWVINHVAKGRPTLETYKYLMPGEADSTEVELYLFNAKTLVPKQIDVSRFKNQTLSLWTKDRSSQTHTGAYPINYWLGNADEFYLARSSRDLKRIDIVAVNLEGETRTVVEERSNVYLDIKKPVFVNNGTEFIHWSQRDGWGHFYLYRTDGSFVRQLTQGAFHCDELARYDEASATFYFKANGKEEQVDPYYTYYYSASLAGGEPKLLSPGDFDHQVQISESGKFFVDNFSRVNTVPKSYLYDHRGNVVMELEEANLENLFAAGYRFPEPFQVKAADGMTDLYGVMYKPYDFDSTKSYPLIEYVYPGPQTEAVNKSFGRSMDRIDRLAQMGFIVVSVGNRGGHPSRSKWYHTYGYGNLRDYGLEDKKAAAEQLAARHAFIDLDRVGITGHSGGGFMSTAAMLVYPDFFKVAVSGAGNHENNIYNRWWSERHHGVTEVVNNEGDTTFSYQIQRNAELAGNLKGKLLLVTGDIDNNVHPANTIRMADALIRANKRFDFLLLPGQRHAFGDMTEYFFWKMADYFSEHLLGNSQRDQVDIVEISREKPRNK